MPETDTTTTPRVTPDSLEDLDFQLTCIVVTVMALWPVPTRCENPAKWVGYSPCCGVAVLTCDPHHASPLPFICEGCHKQFPHLINWHPL